MSEDVELWLVDCNEALTCSNCPFNSWEKEFLESINDQWGEKQYLTEAQVEKLRQCWGKI